MFVLFSILVTLAKSREGQQRYFCLLLMVSCHGINKKEKENGEKILMKPKNKARSVAGIVIRASGGIVEVDILKLSRFLCLGVGICHTSRGLGLMMVKKLDLRLTIWEWPRGEKPRPFPYCQPQI